MTLPSRRWPYILGGFAALLIAGALLFRWDWLIPMVEARASASLGRPVHITHLHVSLGRTTRIEADGITIGNPADWPGGGTFGTAERLGIDVDVMAYVKQREIVLPVIDVQAPKIDAQRLGDGRANWVFGNPDAAPSSDPGPKLGTLRIAQGQAHVRDAKLAADFNVDLETQDSKDGTGQIAATAKGTYAKQPIDARFTGGALLSLRNEDKPYPIDLQLGNGPTKVSLVGTVQNPLNFAGANLRLELSGPDMSLLLPLTGIAIPKTPPYRIAGRLDYGNDRVRFQEFTGKVGSSDLAGTIEVDTKPERPVVTADLQSKLVDLNDLGGFIGAEPGDADKGTKKPARGDGKVLPNDPISLPKLTAADVHLKYRAARIQGRSQPLDNMRAELDIEDGKVHVHPLAFGVGGGQIAADIALEPRDANQVHAKVNIDFQRLDVAKLLSSTGIAKGAGTMSGKAVIDGSGRSMADILGRGNGELRLFMGRGGNVSALLVDISGIQLGNAVLSALGIPNRAQLQCFVAHVVLQQGNASIKTGILDTDESRVGMTGAANLRTETLGMTLETEGKHFSIGSLPTPIDLKGSFAAPSIMPHIGPLAARGGAAIALGIIGTPLAALIPTIDFGTGEDNACATLVRSGQQPARVPAAPANRTRR